jgi:predicted nucleic acid-binding protein
MALAERHGLTLYDATYLELSLRRGLPLATFDAALRRAATATGADLL